MAVHFDLDRMAQVRETHDLWWKGKLDRPLVKVTIEDAHPGEDIPVLSQSNCADFGPSPEQIIDALDQKLSRQEFLGDAFPMVNFDAFGPGVLAAFCGARLDNSSGAVWFFPEEEMEIGQIHAKYDPENPYAKRIKEIYRAGLEKWNGTVIMGIPDLGGVMDVTASLRGTENLLTDLYDAPEEVIRLCSEIQTAWYAAYQDLSAVLAPQNGYTHWSGLLSSAPSYIIQCDFSYMISNGMFREFVLEVLRNDTRRLAHTVYHLDGVGQLNHLDDILGLRDLDAVQWVPGDGQPAIENWPQVYRKIMDAGKLCMISGEPDSYLKLLSQLHGTPYSTHILKSRDTDMANALVRAR